MAEEREPPGGSEQGDFDDASPSPADAPPVLPYASPADAAAPVNFKTLRRMPSFEANLAAAKLEAAGVRAFVADENISVAHPLAFSQVRLQVAEADFERAEQILAQPASAGARREDDDDDKDGDGGDGDDYADEAYRCPKCRRKAVDLLPLSPGMRRVRLGCLGVLLLPVAVSLIAWIVLPDRAARSRATNFPPAVTAVWVLALGVLAYLLLTAERRKRCRDCGHEWGNATAE